MRQVTEGYYGAILESIGIRAEAGAKNQPQHRLLLTV